MKLTRENAIKGYKVTDKDMKCRGYQFSIGTVHKEKKAVLCDTGFHFCVNICKCWNYYEFIPTNRVFEVLAYGYIDGDECDKMCSSMIELVKEITWSDVLKISNTGHSNTGHSNTGDRNAGHSNTGHSNTGDRNAGNRNTGNRNTGNRNTGNRNTGHWNTGDSNTGIFNTIDGIKYQCFNKLFDADIFNNIEFPSFLYFEQLIFVSYDTATDEEKAQHKIEIETCGGFLKDIGYKQAFKLSWLKADAEDRQKIRNIPGFDKDIFFEISGIDVDKD